MKRLFETDSAARVSGVASFEELGQKINEVFAKNPETTSRKLAC